MCKIGKEGSKLIILTHDFQTSHKNVFAIGGAISPAYIAVEGSGTFKEQKHSNLIYTAIKDAVAAMEKIKSDRAKQL